MFSKKTVLIVFITALVLTAVGYFAYVQTQSFHRDIPTLMNHYYRFKTASPWKAKEALDLILAQDPNHVIASRELLYWYMQQGDMQSALHFAEQSVKRHPNDAFFQIQLAKIYLNLGEKKKAKPWIEHLLTNTGTPFYEDALALKRHVNKGYGQMKRAAVLPSYVPSLSIEDESVLAPLYQKAQEMRALNPGVASDYLHLILSINPNAVKAWEQLGYLYLQQGNIYQAKQAFTQAFSKKPDAALALQLGFLMQKTNDRPKAVNYFQYALHAGDEAQRAFAKKALLYLNAPELTTLFETAERSEKDQLLLAFYTAKQRHSQEAWALIKTLLLRYPHDILLWKEAGYLAISQKKTALALYYWNTVYRFDPKPEYAMQLGYLYAETNQYPTSFQYFSRASKTTDKALQYQAEIAMTNIDGAMTKFLPNPWFAEGYVAPFYFSRFNLGVFPMIGRAGRVLNKPHRTELYLSYRRTSDNRSGTVEGLIIANSISQIFEDNVAIYAVGFRSAPIAEIPLLAFIEVGRAEDLIYRDRPKWRGDIRGGFVFYNEWGAKPTWTPKLEFPFEYVSTLYADTIYYSRYNNNIIGTSWFRPGIRVLRYQAASVDIYLANYLVMDKNQDFFNNVYALGPGIMFWPSNRFNLKMRIEAHEGYYLPVNSPIPNPYRSKYYNTFALLEVFARF